MALYDAYSNAPLGYGQLDLYAEAQRDAITAQRRVLEVHPDFVLPARMCVKVSDAGFWILGSLDHRDLWADDTIRRKHVLQRSNGLAGLYTPGAFVTSAAPFATAHMGITWLKDWKDLEQGGDIHPYFEGYLSSTETLLAGHLVSLNSYLYRVRGVHVTEAGFLSPELDLLEEGLETLTLYEQEPYDRVEDEFATLSATLPCLRMRPGINFDRSNPLVKQPDSGEMTVLISGLVVAPKHGSKVRLDGVDYRVRMVDTELDAWRLRLVP